MNMSNTCNAVPQSTAWFFDPNTSATYSPFKTGDVPIEQSTIPIEKKKSIQGVDTSLVFNTGGQPTEQIWRCLLMSLPNVIDFSSRATDSANPNHKTQKGTVIQGLVTVSTDNEAKNFLDGDIDKYTRVPRVHQLPSVAHTDNKEVSNFSIANLLAFPKNAINVGLDLLVNTRNKYLIKISDSFVDWIKDTLDKIKTYIDTITFNATTIEISNQNATNLVFTKIDGNATNAVSFNPKLTIKVVNDDSMIGTNTDIPSVLSVKNYVTNNAITPLAQKADASALNALSDIVDLLQTNKAEKSVVDTILANLNDMVTLTGTQIINGKKSFLQPITGMPAVNDDDLPTLAQMRAILDSEYVSKATYDAQMQIINNTFQSINNSITNIQTTITQLAQDTYTKSIIDNKLALKSDIGHTHNEYHPRVPNAISGINTLSRLSTITIQEGVITGFVN